MRLIDADTLLAEYDKIHVGEPGRARKLIAEQPTIDAVEVVRCKDCVFSEHWYRDRRLCFLWLEDGNALSVFNDGFCNYAERKEDE